MIVIYYMNWNGTIEELNQWEEKQKKHWAKVPGVKLMGIYLFNFELIPFQINGLVQIVLLTHLLPGLVGLHQKREIFLFLDFKFEEFRKPNRYLW